MGKLLTVFTPTYNRAAFLKRNLDVLRRQSNKDFIWLIIDDGSTDNTKETVESFINEENGFDIQYVYKENGGLHTAYNKAIELLTTELCICIDSDDYIAEDAVERIASLWKEIRNEPDCGGIVAPDIKTTGELTGLVYPTDTFINLNQYDVSHKWSGDRKLVVRSDLYKAVAPMPCFEGEKNFNPQYMHMKICSRYQFYSIAEPLCVVDYQETGMSAGILKQYLNSPNSFAEYRRLKMKIMPLNHKYLVRNAIHYDSSCILARKPLDIVLKSPYKFITLFVSPLGIALSIYIILKVKLSRF